ncbi:putative sporulation protein rmd1 protein [Eutypa lata UCREL1]|uniref:Putative sporulation protein rmd1 protein n=1 Tax=Eutypa lata (strain UCR-EL1) TaxID=1287681 RepID=M7T488_EUTLA|nr:putative sporulation protein rmd1 protein [Eutypa lata UCREL1]
MASLPRSPVGPTIPTSSAPERVPLLRQDTARPDTARPRGSRSVTFNPNPVTRTIDPDPFSSLSSSPRTGPPNPLGNARPGSASALSGSGAPNAPSLSALNSRLRRRNSYGSAFTALPPIAGPGAKIGPQRSSKNAQKLKLLPNLELEEDEAPDEESGRDVYSQYTRIKDPMARRDAARLGKADRDKLPRRDDSSGSQDNFSVGRDMHNDLSYPSHPDDESAIHDPPSPRPRDADFDTTVHTPEVFLFDYGVVVIWGMSPTHEQRFLKEISKFGEEKLEPDDVETECFNFYYTREYQPRIYNDFITLRDKRNYMTKLAISHALAQSVKTSLFEELIASTVDTCKDVPTQIALTGKIALSRRQINMQIGELFILRINIHLNGSVLDTPELFWAEPHLEPVYQAVRSYLEMDQRVNLLTERMDVIADLLAVLKDQLSHGHGEMLEWIVIVLIAAEILVAAINIVVDLYAGVD